MHKVSIQSIPFDANSSYLRGAADGPEKAIEAFYCDSANFCTQDGIDLSSLTNHWLIEDPIKFTDEDPKTAFDHIYQHTINLLAKERKVLSIGGDHSITFPILKAYAEKYGEIHVLQVDAHGDLYDNFEDNYYSHASPFARIMEEGLVGSLTQIGNRTLNPHQREQAKRFGVKIIEMKNFDERHFPNLKAPLYISFDLDVLDPAYAPGVSHYEPGGMTTREALKMLEVIDVPLVGADIVELNPKRDVHGMTAMVAGKLMKEFLAMMM